MSKRTVQTIKDKTADNIILIDKPVDWSSFDVVKKIRRIGKFTKTGHGGTLDPFASGLLILGTGRETRSLADISAADKSYLATIFFGCATDTFDSTGRITEKKENCRIDIEKVKSAVKEFTGIVRQKPPMFSAKKVSGTRLYKLARKGIEIERKSVPVKFHEINIVSFDTIEVVVYIKCSKGTYIRSFANDLGKACGYPAHLKELKRLSIGKYKLDDALSIGEFASYWNLLN